MSAPKFLLRRQQRDGGNTSPVHKASEERKTQAVAQGDFVSKQYEAMFGQKSPARSVGESPILSSTSRNVSPALMKSPSATVTSGGSAVGTASSVAQTTKVLQKADLLSREEIENALQEIEDERLSTESQLEQVRISLQDRKDAAQQLLQDTYSMDTASKLKSLPPQFQNIAKSALEEAKAEVENQWSDEELRLLDWLEELVNEKSRLKEQKLQKQVQHAKDIREALQIPSQDQTDKFRQLTDKLLESESQRADIVIELGQAQRTAQDLRRLLSSKGADEVRHAREVVARMERDLEASQEERRKLAKTIAELQSRNAILMAEKSRWLEQVQEENSQLQNLFKEARSAKEMMVRELNLIDRERRELEEERHQIRSKLQQHNRNVRSGPGGSNNSGVWRVGASTLRSAERLNAATKKLSDELNIRQNAMRNVFNAGKGILESLFRQNMQPDGNQIGPKYIPSQKFNNFDRLYTQLVAFALDADYSVVLEASRNNIVFKGEFAAVNMKIDSIAIAFEDRLRAQTSYLADNKSRLESKWIDMWSNLDVANDDAKLNVEMKKMLLEIGSIIPRALAAGGSAQTAGEEAMQSHTNSSRGDGTNIDASDNALLKQEVESLKGELDRLQSVHRALHNNHNMLKQKINKQKGVL